MSAGNQSKLHESTAQQPTTSPRPLLDASTDSDHQTVTDDPFVLPRKPSLATWQPLATMGPLEEDSLPPTFPHQHPLLPLEDTQAIGGRVSQLQMSLGSGGSKANDTQGLHTQALPSQLQDSLPNDPAPSQAPEETEQSGYEDRTLNENDSGAVNFGNLSEFMRPSSPASQDGGFASAANGDWRVSEQHSYTPYKPDMAPPETPALPKNPFASKQGGAIPFDGTQLFGQTQLLTSAIKNHSPTSSRPSPNVLHDSISPNVMQTSPLKNRANVSSPTDIRTSSPSRLHEVPNTVIKGDGYGPQPEETPLHNKDANLFRVPESPTLQRPRSAGSHQPLAHYETMQKSQERKVYSDTAPASGSADSDSDDAFQQMQRKKRIEKKRALAAEELDRVSYIRPRNVSTGLSGRKRRRLGEDTRKLNGDEVVTGQQGVDTPAGKDLSTNLRDSQKAIEGSTVTPSLDESTKATPGDEPDTAANRNKPTGPLPSTATELIEEEMIPATSPMQPSSANNNDSNAGDHPASEPELPRLPEEEAHDSETGAESSSLPPMRNTRRRTMATRRKMNPFISSSASSIGRPEKDGKDIAKPSAQTERPEKPDPYEFNEMDVDSDKTPKAVPPLTTRSKSKKRSPLTPLQPVHELDVPPTVSSSLTVLSTTPQPSSRTSPDTKISSVTKSIPPSSVASPSASRNLRKRPPRSKSGSESPQPIKFVAVSNRLDSDATDDPRQSPSVSALEVSLARSKSKVPASTALAAVSRSEGNLFAGMNFAISISQQGKGGHDDDIRKALEAKIADAGGVVLQDGFTELFEASSIMSPSEARQDSNEQIKLLEATSGTGFTALIADGHSRRAKYMQALALGLPCLAHQWVEACLRKSAIVDWQPYLLCAGSSDVLGNAVRSRCILPYLATEVRLEEMIDARARLLEGQSLLAVIDPKKVRGQTKRQYIFLTEAMAPVITRVSTVQQAQEAIQERQDAGEAFDWLYIHSSSGTADAVLAAPASKKRRRGKAARPKIRILHNELVIQSLILGRMVEEEDETTFDKQL